LLFLILDKAEMETDAALSKHILHVHKYLKNPDKDFIPILPSAMKQFIAVTRSIIPIVPKEMTSYIVEAYVTLRYFILNINMCLCLYVYPRYMHMYSCIPIVSREMTSYIVEAYVTLRYNVNMCFMLIYISKNIHHIYACIYVHRLYRKK
jgi:DNA replicative helicase MCM subunit Mcm2 (Cdc46/Mcm family)